MHKNKFYITAFIIGVICAAYFIYTTEVKPDKQEVFVAAPVAESEAVIFPSPDNTLYQMGLYLDINHRLLYGSTVLDTINTSGMVLDELWFTVYPNAFRDAANTPAPRQAYYAGFDAGWMEFTQVKVNGQEVEFFLEGVSLQVNPSEDILPGQKIKIEMDWKAKIPRLAYRYGSKDGVFMLGNFYPALNVLTDKGWHTSYNSVFGDPFCFHTADYIVRLNTPEAYDIVSTGINIAQTAEDNGRQTCLIEAKNVRDFSLVVMYDYRELVGQNRNTTVKVYAPGRDIRTAQRILKQSGEILDFYSCKMGSYPYPEFKVVFVPMQGFHGMEYSGLIFLREEFLSPSFDKERSDFILAHEIAHQWWYGIVGNDQLREPWLDEGLANWSAYKYLQTYKGRKPPAAGMHTVNLSRELREIYSTQEYYLTAYSGGEAFWFGLEKELGEDTIYKVLRRYLADYQYNIASTDDLLQVIKKEAHRDMTDYFNKWFRDE